MDGHRRGEGRKRRKRPADFRISKLKFQSMATGATLKAFQSQYQTLKTQCDIYERVHNQLIRALRRSLALLARCKSLAAATTLLDRPISAFGVDDPATSSRRSRRSLGVGVDGLTPLMISRTLSRLTLLTHRTIPDILDELVAVTKSMQAVKRQAQELHSRLRKSASEKVMARRSGPTPSIRQCVNGVEEIVEMHVRETRLCTLFAGRERGWLDGVSYMCLDDDVYHEVGTNEDSRVGRDGRDGRHNVSDRDRAPRIDRGLLGGNGSDTLLDACAELVDVLGCLEARKVHVAQIEMMHTVLATVEV